MHIITIADDGYILITTLWKFTKIKKFDINKWCIEKQLYGERPHISRKLKSLAITTELAITVNEIPLSTCEKIAQINQDSGDMAAVGFIGSNNNNKNKNDQNGQNEQNGQTGQTPRRGKSAGTRRGSEEAVKVKNAGCIAVGTSCGEIVLLPLGTTI